jgi:hypothetical protein
MNIEKTEALYTDASGRGKGPGYEKLNHDLISLTALLADFSKHKI